MPRAHTPMLAVHHISDYGGPYGGSFVPALAETARETGRRGGVTTVWVRERLADREWLSEFDGIADVRWLGEGRGIGPTLTALRAALAEHSGPAALHTHFSNFDIPAALAKMGRPRTAVFWHEHNRPRTHAQALLRNGLRYSLLAQTIDGILCVSPEINADLRRRGAPRRVLRTFPNAIDLARFSPAAESRRREAREVLGIDPDAQVVLHFSWDWERKGGDLIVDAARLSAGSRVRWITVPGPRESSGVLGPSGELVCLPARNDVEVLYAAADVLVSPSRSEGMPFAVLEALACGLPVAASDLPGQRPLLAGLPAGRIVELTPQALVQAVDEILALDATVQDQHRRMARERVADAYSLTTWARRLLDLYEECSN